MDVESQNAPAAGDPENGSEPAVPAARRVNPALLGAILLLLAAGVGWYLYSRGYEETDDAEVDGHLNPIASRVDGTITAVRVDDNDTVRAGQPLVELDPRDLQAQADQAQAEFDRARAQLGASHPNLPITRIGNRADLASQQAEVAGAEAALSGARQDLAGAQAKLKEAQAVYQRDEADFRRYRTLRDKQEVSAADFDQYRSAAEAQAQTVASNGSAVDAARKTVEQREAELAEQRSKLAQTLRSAPLQVAIREADIQSQQANTEAAQAALEKARLKLSYCRIVAPVAGVVTQRSAEVGARVSAGQQLLMIVQIDDLWVTANFKETQLARMHPGQRAKIHVDALGEDFSGFVESMPAITGSRASVLPPENATGNFVKVIQRMPVRIRLDKNQKDLERLRPGMSVEPSVRLD